MYHSGTVHSICENVSFVCRWICYRYNVGDCFVNGTGVVKDEVEAVRWYQMVASAGLAKAQYWLGVCYFKGTGIAKDENEAVR
jgi:uncharacterized protein